MATGPWITICAEHPGGFKTGPEPYGCDPARDRRLSKTVTSRTHKGNFDIYGPDGWGADYPDQQD